MPARLPLRSLLATALAALAALAASASSAQAAPLRYVALGDSYSAASGVLPPDPAAAARCLRSTRNYPHVLADALGAQLTDATCGAADTTHFRAAQYPGVPPQLDALRPDTELVTLTIGGNDSSVFIDTIAQCAVAGAATALQGDPCEQQHGTSFEDTIRTTTYPAIVQALADVRARAPQATVLILTYPWIMPASGGCPANMPIATGDVAYVRRIQATLNDAVRRAATATGVTAVDLDGPSEGHDACQPIGVRWIEPVIGGTNPVVVHPNAFGESEMAADALRTYRSLQAPAAPTGTTTTGVSVDLPGTTTAAWTSTPPAATAHPAATPAAAVRATLSRRPLAGRRVRLACGLRGATARSCRVTVAERRGGRTRTLRTVTVAPGRTVVVRTGAARRLVLRAVVTAADGRRYAASRTLVRSS